MARTIAGAAPGRTNRRFLIIAVIFAVMSGVLAYTLLSRDSGGGGSATAGDTQVVVAKQAILHRTLITADMLELKSVSADAVIGGAYTSVTDVVGKTTRFPLDANQQISTTAVYDKDNVTTGVGLAEYVPTGKRAVSISSSQVIAAGGLVLPGDYVDVVWICCDDKAILAKTVLQNVQVAAVAQTVIDTGGTSGTENPLPAAQAESDPEASTVTLFLTPEETHLVRLAEVSGPLTVTLRTPNDGNIASPENDYTTALELLPLEIVQQLPKSLWPDSYRDGQ
jgi:pilus assembly protein CpaB